MLPQVEPIFYVDPFQKSVQVLLCEMESVRRGSECVMEPVREVTGFTTKPIEPFAQPQPTFHVGRLQLQKLADDLAAVGIYPSSIPEATDHHLQDVRHSRDFLEGVVSTLTKRTP